MFDDSANYERFMGRWSRRLAPLVVDAAGIEPGDRVLDVGTGTGALVEALARRPEPAAIAAIDPAAAYVARAAAACTDPRVRFEVADARALPFGDGAFDRVLSMLALNFVPAPGQAARELRRVTRRSGTVVAAVWDYAEGMQMLRTFWDAAVALDPGAAARDERHMPNCAPEALEQLFRAAGFAAVEVVPLEIDTVFASFADYWEPFLLGTGPAGAYVRGLDPTSRETLRESLARGLGSAADRPVTLRARAFCARARA